MRGRQRHVAYHDVHVPHEIPFKPILEFQKDYKPTHVIINGDFMNLDHASHWNEGLFKHIGYSDVSKALFAEIDAAKDLINRIRAASPNAELTFVPGNHENWLYWCALYHPQLGLLLGHGVNQKSYKADLARAGDEALAELLTRYLEADKFKMRVLPYNQPLEIGHITYLHGHQLTISNSPRLYPSKNLVFGHHHTHNTVTLNDSGDYRHVVQHVAVPCMTKLGPKAHAYRQVKAGRWLNGFWIADVLPNGLFDGRVKKVLGGEIMIP